MLILWCILGSYDCPCQLRSIQILGNDVRILGKGGSYTFPTKETVNSLTVISTIILLLHYDCTIYLPILLDEASAFRSQPIHYDSHHNVPKNQLWSTNSGAKPSLAMDVELSVHFFSNDVLGFVQPLH